jgi:hypothetical protein
MNGGSFRYADAFTPVGPRKKRRNKFQADRDHRASLSLPIQRATEENERDGWMARCTGTCSHSYAILTDIEPCFVSNLAGFVGRAFLDFAECALPGPRKSIHVPRVPEPTCLPAPHRRTLSHCTCVFPPLMGQPRRSPLRIKEHGRVSIYDPVFTEEDVALLTELELSRLTENKASPTAFWS